MAEHEKTGSLPKPESPICPPEVGAISAQPPSGSAVAFRCTVRSLLKRERLSQRLTADRVGVPYKWLRRVCHQGLKRTDRRSLANLQRLAAYFDLQLADFWGETPPSPVSHFDVLVKWTGSKRSQATRILRHFPRRIGTYFEPFLGGGSVLLAVLRSKIEIERIQCSDLCPPLIGIWKLVQNAPEKLAESYAEAFERAKTDLAGEFQRVRERFNAEQDPADFFFLLRTCRKGMVRFNKKGQFTSAAHHGRPGMSPDTVTRLIGDWNALLRDRDVTFEVTGYEEVRPTVGDWLYLDPPYRLNRTLLYQGRFGFDRFFDWLGGVPCGYALSLNGTVGRSDRLVEVPGNLYDGFTLLRNGKSAAHRLAGVGERALRDALYVRESP